MRPVYITAIASALPNAAVANEDMERILGMAGNRPSRARAIVLRSNGIKTRYYAIHPLTGEQTHTNAELTAAAVAALPVDEDDVAVGCLACGTSLPDQLMPNHAVMVQGELKLPACEVIATSGVCLAGMTAFKYAWLAVASGEHERAIATGSEVASGVMRGSMFAPEVESRLASLEKIPELVFEKDFLRWMLSDGAGAVRLASAPARLGLSLRVEWLEIRSYADRLETCMYTGAVKQADGSLQGWKSLRPQQWLEQSVFAVKQDVKLLNSNIVSVTVEQFLPEILRKHGLSAADVSYFLPHYSSDFFRQPLYDGMKNAGCEIPFERWATNLTEKGNTGSASIYIMLDELFHSGRLKTGEKILCYVPESGRFSSSFMLLQVCDSISEV